MEVTRWGRRWIEDRDSGLISSLDDTEQSAECVIMKRELSRGCKGWEWEIFRFKTE